MKPFTIEEKIKVLFQGDVQNRDVLLAEYSTCDAVRKAEMVQIITDQYSELFDELAILKHEQLMGEITAGTRVITSDLMQQAYAAVHDDLVDVLTGKAKDDEEIKNIQQKIQSLSVVTS